MGLIATGSSPPLPAFAVPDKRRGLLIPALRRLLKPAPDLVWAVRMLSIQRPSLEHALNRLRHIEPAAAHGRVERHDPPCAHNHSTRSGVLWPVRLSHTSNRRSGGRSSGRVTGIVRPA